MAAYKQFLTSDVIVTPFEVNKGFTFASSSFGDSDVQIFTYEGKNSDPETQFGSFNGIQRNLLYNSIKQLYYSNYLSSSIGDMPVSASILPGETPEGDVLRGPSSSTGRYFNYLQTSLTQSRDFPTASNSEIAVFSIPSRLFGDYIQPESFIWEDNTNNALLTDDGEGNVIISGSSVIGGIVGNIIYQHGIIIITNDLAYDPLNINDFTTATNVTCSFSSSYEIFETQYKATVNEFEYNFSQNPSIISGSTDGSVYDFTTGSFFQPYATTVGLYNEAQELLAVGKLSQPYPLSRTTDTTFYINIDR
tara:strand:+ start:2394 stop:3311 length:918 start_codon:yes stop_codon:yes gene_type:complete